MKTLPRIWTICNFSGKTLCVIKNVELLEKWNIYKINMETPKTDKGLNKVFKNQIIKAYR